MVQSAVRVLEAAAAAGDPDALLLRLQLLRLASVFVVESCESGAHASWHVHACFRRGACWTE